MPFEVAELRSAIALANEILGVAVGVNSLLGDTNSTTNTILGDVEGLRASLDALGGSESGHTADLQATLNSLGTRLNHIETKVSTIQHIIASIDGLSVDDNVWPTLDLRPLIGGIANFAPGNGSLYQWLIYLLHQTVPNVATNYRHLGQITGPATFALPDSWGLATHATTIPPGISRSANPDAPIQWFIGRVSFGRDGYYEASKAIQHEKQLFLPDGFIPSGVALECRPGAVIEVYAVMPYGYI